MNQSSSHILVTGGAGYIGSHTVLELLQREYQVLILDNLERGYKQATDRIQEISSKQLSFQQVDLRNFDELQSILSQYQISAVIHFAAYKDVGEADREPEKFYQNNVLGTLNLLNAMKQQGINKIIFSSTSAVYGMSEVLPMHEGLPVQPLNAYGHTKASVEWMLQDFFNAHDMSSASLRYFNAAGAHPSGNLGEDPGRCGNIIPLLMQTLIGKRDSFNLYGDQFNTPDGTQMRDYIHVMDLASGHVAALQKLEQTEGAFVYNLGTGEATSNLQLIQLAEQVSSRKLNYQVVDPRPGDPPITQSDPRKANQELNWQAKYSVQQIIEDQWRWVSQNPNGYEY